MQTLNNEQIDSVCGGDSWAGTPEGRAPAAINTFRDAAWACGNGGGLRACFLAMALQDTAWIPE